MTLQKSHIPLMEKKELFEDFFERNFHQGIHSPASLQAYSEHSLVWDNEGLTLFENRAKEAKEKLERFGYEVAILRDSGARFGSKENKILVFADNKQALEEVKSYFLFNYNYEE